MAVSYNVIADVVDVTTDAPNENDTFIVDSNVWYWLSYSRCSMAKSPPMPYQVRAYPTFVSAAVVARSGIRRCELSVAELAWLIERTEFDIFAASAGSMLNPKEYRHNLPAERARVMSEIQAAWSVVENMAKPLPFAIDESVGRAVMASCGASPMDGYDALLGEAARQNGIVQVLTDDGDFCTVPGITVFTANATVIRRAKAANRLIVR